MACAFETSFNAAAAKEAFDGLKRLGSSGALEPGGVTGRKMGEFGVACGFAGLGERFCQPNGGDICTASPAEFVCGDVVNILL